MSVISDIRKAAVAALKAAAPIVVNGVEIPKDKIFDSPSYDLDDIEDLPAAIAVYLTSVKSERISQTSQFYLKTYQLVVEVVLGASTDEGLADLVSESEDVINGILLLDRSWSAGSRRVEVDGAEFRKRTAARGRSAGINIGYLISVEQRYTATPTGTAKVHVEISPKPNTTAGWEA